jgi:hypothetical protein
MSHPFIDDPKYWHERAAEAWSIANCWMTRKPKGIFWPLPLNTTSLLNR